MSTGLAGLPVDLKKSKTAKSFNKVKIYYIKQYWDPVADPGFGGRELS